MSAPIFWGLIPAAVAFGLYLYKPKTQRIIFFIIANLIFALVPFIVLLDPISEPSFFQIEMDSAFNILGRNFIITQSDLFLIQLIYFFNALWGAAVLAFKRNARMLPFGMLFTSLLLAAYSVTPFMYSALIIEMAVIISIPMFIEAKQTSKRGVMRYLIYQSLAMPFILLAGWFLAGGEITPVNQEQLVQAAALLGLGFVLWLGISPFHTWLSILFDESELINAGYLLQVLLVTLLLLMLKFMDGFPWLREFDLFYEAVQLLGITMTIIGSLGFLAKKKIRKITGYYLIHSLGNILISIGVYQHVDIYLFTSFISSFIINFSLFIFASQYLNTQYGAFVFSDLPLLKKAIAPICIIFSTLSLAGMPLTLGFPPNQILYHVLAGNNGAYFILMLISKSFITFAVFRWLKNLLKQEVTFKTLIPDSPKSWALAALLIMVIIAGLFPQIIFSNFRNLVIGFENLIQ